MKKCGTPGCLVCETPFAVAEAQPQDVLARAIIWHLAGTGEGQDALSLDGRLIVQADALRRRIECQPRAAISRYGG